MDAVKKQWTESKMYRVALVTAIIYTTLRLAIQIFLFSDALRPDAVEEGVQVSADLQQSYIPAAQHFWSHEDLYRKGSLEHVEAHYLYSPAFAFIFSPILLLPLNVLLPLLLLIHIAVYALLYVWWGRIFQRNRLVNVGRQWARLLPLYLVFSPFWDDLAYMNTYIIVALFATFLVDAILQEELGWAVFWLGTVILPMKPHWAFAVALPLILGRHRFFFKLILGTILAYIAVTGITMLAGGSAYVLRQYQDYFAFLARLSRDYPWWGPDKPFLGYNHSVMQTILYYFDATPTNMTLATIIKLVLLLPLGWISLKYILKPIGKKGSEVPETALAFVFVLYLGAFIWLDMVWELSLGLIIFAYLLTVNGQRWKNTLIWLVFAPYALLDIWRLVTYIAFGDAILYNGSYLLSDPFLYIPWILVILLLFYGLLIAKLTKQPVAVT